MTLLLVAACSGNDAVAVELAEVTAGEVVQTVAAPATVEPRAQQSVGAPVSGTVDQLLVDDGDEVTAGQPVLHLSSESIDAAIAQARSGVDAASALASVQVPSVDLAPLITPVRRQLETVVPPLLDALEAQAQAIPDDTLKLQALDQIVQARAQYRIASRDLRAAESAARRATGSATDSQRAAAAAQREQAEAALTAAQEREEALTLTAPIAGVIEFARGDAAPAAGGAGVPEDLQGLLGGAGGGGGGELRVGARVGLGQTLFTVYDLGDFHLSATVDEVDAVLVQEEQRATIFVDAYPDDDFSGVVTAVGVGPEQGASGAVVYPVRVAFTSRPADLVLRVGMTASVEIEVRDLRSDTTVPAPALLRRGDRDVVLVADGDRVREVPVEIEAIGEEVAAVTGDLEPGQQVVVTGTEDLEDGDRLPQ